MTHRLAKRFARCACWPSSRFFVGAGEDEEVVVAMEGVERDVGVLEVGEKFDWENEGTGGAGEKEVGANGLLDL